MLALAMPLAMSAADDGAFPALTRAVLAHAKDIPKLLDAAFIAQPHHPRLHALRALMLVIAGRSEVLPAARAAALQAQSHAKTVGCSKADSAFVAAAFAAANGDWQGGILHLETCLFHDPQDTLAAKMSHALRFMLGDKAGMLSSIRQVMVRLSAHHPHRGFMLGCLAFALEENGCYLEAHRIGQEAVLREPADVWGLHAVSHVHEMTGRHQDGIAWIEGHRPRFADCNNFGGHLFWHLALFKLESGAIGEVFALYDAQIRQDKTDDFRDIANAASLLARLEIEGYKVGNRWEELADKAETRLSDHALVFADLHYVLALLGAGRAATARLLAQGLAHASAPSDDQKEVAKGVGGAMAEGLIAFSEKRYGAALEALSASRVSHIQIGGSDAQRDLFEQILIESALKAGEVREAQRLLSLRLMNRYGRNNFASRRLNALLSRAPMQRGTAVLALGAALAYAQPAE